LKKLLGRTLFNLDLNMVITKNQEDIIEPLAERKDSPAAMPIEENKDVEEIVNEETTEIKKTRLRKRRTVLKKVKQGNKARSYEQKECSELPRKKRRRKRKSFEMDKSGGKNKTAKLRTKQVKKQKRREQLYEHYYQGRRKKFGWGVDEDKVTKEQMQERAKLKSRSFRRNMCHLCKARFRMKFRLEQHIKKQSCSCKDCGVIYESAFQRSDHKLTCKVRQKRDMMKKEPKRYVKTQPAPAVKKQPLSMFATSPYLNFEHSTLELGPLPEELQSESNFALPTLTIKFWPAKIKQPIIPTDNEKFSRSGQRQLDGPSAEPSLATENGAELPPRALDREIKSLLINCKKDTISDF